MRSGTFVERFKQWLEECHGPAPELMPGIAGHTNAPNDCPLANYLAQECRCYISVTREQIKFVNDDMSADPEPWGFALDAPAWAQNFVNAVDHHGDEEGAEIYADDALKILEEVAAFHA